MRIEFLKTLSVTELKILFQQPNLTSIHLARLKAVALIKHWLARLRKRTNATRIWIVARCIPQTYLISSRGHLYANDQTVVDVVNNIRWRIRNKTGEDIVAKM